MKYQNFISELKDLGVKVENGTGHLKLYYKGKQTTCPRHPSKEISNNFAKLIKKTTRSLSKKKGWD